VKREPLNEIEQRTFALFILSMQKDRPFMVSEMLR